MMKYQQRSINFLRSFTLLLLTLSNSKFTFNVSSNSLSLKTLPLDGNLCFEEVHYAARDFGNRFRFLPSVILHPKSVSDISTVVGHIWESGPTTGLTVAARGNGHSLHGQSQASGGLVIDMGSLRGKEMRFYMENKYAYVDVSGGELWINVLQESLKLGLSPKSWTDYLYLSVGGTLSNAGVSGQAFKHGPQISNVHELEVVTGKGEVLICSEKENLDLFHAVLGGLGQFGIITRARISLEPAPKMVKWIRVLYSDFSTFTRDQELLISTYGENKIDYIEGFVQINRTGLIDNWRTSFTPQDPVQAGLFKSDGKTLFCLELAKYFNPRNIDVANKEIESLLSQLSYIPSTLFTSEVAYIDFLNRVHVSEIKLRLKGLWEVPHPWLNLLIPKSNIHKFAQVVFGNLLTDSSNGPILIYPVNKSKWDNRTSVVTPDEDIFYLVGFLASAVPSSAGTDGLEHILMQNKKILDFCRDAKIEAKQYLPHYTNQEEWRSHFGDHWDVFRRRKSAYDPLAILGPGHRIFKKGNIGFIKWDDK